MATTSPTAELTYPPVLAILTPLPLSRPGTPSPTDDSFPPAPVAEEQQQREGDGTMTGELEMRVSLARRILSALQGGRNGRTLVASLVITMIQLISWSIVLGVTSGSTCDRPLKLYLILTVVRLGLSIPFLIHSAVVPPRPNRRDGPEQIAARELTRQVSSMERDRQIRRASDLVSTFSLAVFIMGNVVVNTSVTCRTTAPVLYRSAVAALVLSWFWNAQVILVVLSCIFFLPVLLIAIRFFGMGTAKHEVGPLTTQQIDKIPQRVYLGAIPEPVVAAPASTSTDVGGKSGDQSSLSQGTEVEVKAAGQGTLSTNAEVLSVPSTSSPPPQHKRQLWRLWRRPKRRSGFAGAQSGSGASTGGDFVPLPKGMEGVRLPESQDACSICLMEYELPPCVGDPGASEWVVEPLKLLPCKHAFHSPCLDSWLLVSGRCPLCQAAVIVPKGKKGRRGSAQERPDVDPGSVV